MMRYYRWLSVLLIMLLLSTSLLSCIPTPEATPESPPSVPSPEPVPSPMPAPELTPVKPGEQQEKSLKVRQYQVVEARGYTTKEIQQVRTELQEQKIVDLKLRWREEIIEIDHTNPLAQIVLPLMIQRLEGKAVQLRSQDFEGYLIDVPAHLQTVVDAYKQLPASFKSDHLHPRYVALEPGQRVDSLQMGRDLLEAVRPDYQVRIQEMVSRALCDVRENGTLLRQKLMDT